MALPPISGTAKTFDMLAGNRIHYSWVPECTWECIVTHRDLQGEFAEQTIVITIPALNFTAGRLTATVTGGSLDEPAVLTAVAATGDDQEDLASALASEIEALEGVVSSSSDAEVVSVRFSTGIGPVTISLEYEPAQLMEVDWDPGAIAYPIVDGTYSVIISGGSLVAPVQVDVNAVSVASPTALADLIEVAVEGLIATTLAGAVVSATNTAAVNAIQFEPLLEGEEPYEIEIVSAEAHRLTFGGTATDGNYVTSIDNETLLPGPVGIVVVRAAGSPASNTDLANQYETQFEAHAQLDPFFFDADNTAGANMLRTFPGATGFTVTAVSAPAPGTLVVVSSSPDVTDTTPDGPEITIAHSVVIELNNLHPRREFPTNVIRLPKPNAIVKTAFAENTTVDLGDNSARAGVLSAVAIEEVGTHTDAGTDEGDGSLPELDWAPFATFHVDSPTITAGEVVFAVDFRPLGTM